LLEAARFWLGFGVDGFRLDYAIGPVPDFWADFRKETRQAKPDCWTFGEVVDPPDRQLSFDGLIDGCLDFMLLEALRQTFAFGRWEAQRFASFLDRHEAFFPEDFSRPSFLDNHDMNRFLWACSGDKRRLRLAALCQFTLNGPPVIYYGTESGLSQERDIRQGGWGIPEEARQPMNWDSLDDDLLEFYRGLGALRKTHPCLSRGERKLVTAEGGILAYRRSLGEEQLTVVMNLSEKPAEVRLSGCTRDIFSTSEELEMKSAQNECVFRLPALSGVAVESSGDSSPRLSS
jgi:glycosidase